MAIAGGCGQDPKVSCCLSLHFTLFIPCSLLLTAPMLPWSKCTSLSLSLPIALCVSSHASFCFLTCPCGCALSSICVTGQLTTTSHTGHLCSFGYQTPQLMPNTIHQFDRRVRTDLHAIHWSPLMCF